ncbi:MAG: radical SAM protein [Elusimicrobia bacterium]|nr:MAG: radical SAM protein [Elusimicrobiota bacterium]
MPAAAKWVDPETTAKGERRATVDPRKLETLWFNTGTLCNIECSNCYIESSPKNNRLEYLKVEEVRAFLHEIKREGLGTREIGFTGGEPFLNPDMVKMIETSLEFGHEVLVLTNAMKPLMNRRKELLAVKEKYGVALRMRVSLDHHSSEVHDKERGKGSFSIALEGLRWLCDNGFSVNVAGRSLTDEPRDSALAGYQGLFKGLESDLDSSNANHLVIFPEMDGSRDFPEITTDCWEILHKEPANIMCASSRMVVKRNGDDAPTVQACTLIAYDERFAMGKTLKESWKPVSLVHPSCASFCVLGGASCST